MHLHKRVDLCCSLKAHQVFGTIVGEAQVSILIIVYLDITLDIIFYYLLLIISFLFYRTKNSVGVRCGVLGIFRHLYAQTR